MKIKEPVLKELVVYALYEVDVEGVKVDVDTPTMRVTMAT